MSCILALAFHEPNPDVIEERITDYNYRLWQRFYARNPWGPGTDWFHFASLAALIINTAPNRRQGAPMAKPADFMPAREPEAPRVQSQAEMLAVFKTVFPEMEKKGKADAGNGEDHSQGPARSH